jgi:hypothetical protein
MAHLVLDVGDSHGVASEGSKFAQPQLEARDRDTILVIFAARLSMHRAGALRRCDDTRLYGVMDKQSCFRFGSIG